MPKSQSQPGLRNTVHMPRKHSREPQIAKNEIWLVSCNFSSTKPPRSYLTSRPIPHRIPQRSSLQGRLYHILASIKHSSNPSSPFPTKSNRTHLNPIVANWRRNSEGESMCTDICKILSSSCENNSAHYTISQMALPSSNTKSSER